MQGRLHPPLNFVCADDPEGTARHREALGEECDRYIERESEWMRSHDCRYWLPDGVPSLARLGPEVPRILFVQGEVDLSRPCVSVVGSRKADSYGLEIAYLLGRCLGRAGVNVVSGGAFGIDRAAHEGALDGGGMTIAVMAGGLARLHPPGNTDLFARLLASGSAIISERPVGVSASRWAFTHRNRIVAALADAVVVAQAAGVSGALNTAGWALDMEVPLFAVPADAWYLEAAGGNSLLSRGAFPLTNPRDLARVPELAVLARGNPGWPRPVHRPRGHPPPWAKAVPPAGPRPDGHDGPIARTLACGPRTLDEIVSETGISAGTVQATVLEMEIAGEVARLPGGTFMLTGGNR